jgi:hypothetical protein
VRIKYDMGRAMIKERPVQTDEKGKIKWGEVIDLIEALSSAKIPMGRSNLYYCVKFAVKYPALDVFEEALESTIERAVKEAKKLSTAVDEFELGEKMRSWEWIRNHMLVDQPQEKTTGESGEEDEESVLECEVDTAECSGDVREKKLKVCGEHWDEIKRSIERLKRPVISR